MFLRKKRLEKQLGQRISEAVHFELNDPHLSEEIISFTQVEVTNDFSTASVYFTLLNDEHKNRVIKALYRSAPFLKRLLQKRIRIRRVPDLKFFYDHDTLSDPLAHHEEKVASSSTQDNFSPEDAAAAAAAYEDFISERRENLSMPSGPRKRGKPSGISSRRRRPKS